MILYFYDPVYTYSPVVYCITNHSYNLMAENNNKDLSQYFCGSGGHTSHGGDSLSLFYDVQSLSWDSNAEEQESSEGLTEPGGFRTGRIHVPSKCMLEVGSSWHNLHSVAWSPHSRVSGFPEWAIQGPKVETAIFVNDLAWEATHHQFAISLILDQPSSLCVGTIQRCGYQEMPIIRGYLGGWVPHLAWQIR